MAVSTSALDRARNLTTIVALCGVSIAAIAQPDQQTIASAKPPQALSLSTATGPAFARGKAGARWAELLNQLPGHPLDVRHFPGAALAARDPALEFRVLQNGPVQLAVGSALEWSADVPAFGVFALPWFAATPQALHALSADPPLNALLRARASKAGVAIVLIAPLGHHVLSTARAPVVVPSDLAGLRLRASAAPLVTDTYRVLGALATPSSFAAAQAEFAAGRLDGQDGRAAAFAATRIATLSQKHVTRLGAFGDAMIFAVRASIWDAWDDELQAAVSAAAISAAAEFDVAMRDDAALAELAASGITITRLSPSGRRAFREATRTVFDRYADVVGRDVVDAATAALAALPAADR